MNKYNAKKVIVTSDGTMFEEAQLKKYNIKITGNRFDSMMEGEYYRHLLQLKKIGLIKDFTLQPKYILQEKPKITYIADFLITDMDGSERVVDIKGAETAVFRTKLKLFQVKYPTMRIEILTKKSGEFVPLDQVKKEKAAQKRAANKLMKKAGGKMKYERIDYPKGRSTRKPRY
ncbi:DUF1064 domain-containing protein [Paenibacillus sp. FSL E2-0202]|uniref:DUF1064 domain-containing protein n=1 Tax=Paenibacillus sp. FSL E2-0202 TaxID=2954505 RepID=UPI0030EBCCEE